MTRLWIGVVFVVAALVSGIAVQASFDAEHQSAPPRRERPTRGRFTGTPAPPEVNGADPSATGELVAVTTYLDALEQERLEQERIAVAAYLDALEQTRLAEQAAAQAAQPRTVRPQMAPSNTSVSGPSSCDGHAIPSYIVQRESGCNYGAVNGSGCGGSGCYGMYQIAGFHWSAGGACSDLNWTVPADQDTCARRLSNNGTNLTPWGG